MPQLRVGLADTVGILAGGDDVLAACSGLPERRPESTSRSREQPGQRQVVFVPSAAGSIAFQNGATDSSTRAATTR